MLYTVISKAFSTLRTVVMHVFSADTFTVITVGPVSHHVHIQLTGFISVPGITRTNTSDENKLMCVVSLCDILVTNYISVSDFCNCELICSCIICIIQTQESITNKNSDCIS